ncbi:unnamed protein product [Ostreobium quekettii]|uniref:VWFA domain-containing protein n=1 Tax=Ostreobium quekettii TaxID=121088 RepID=A0A8S1ISU5_9CHLO|nr:unnamed protein product [Ostreobium quekettii]
MGGQLAGNPHHRDYSSGSVAYAGSQDFRGGSVDFRGGSVDFRGGSVDFRGGSQDFRGSRDGSVAGEWGRYPGPQGPYVGGMAVPGLMGHTLGRPMPYQGLPPVGPGSAWPGAPPAGIQQLESAPPAHGLHRLPWISQSAYQRPSPIDPPARILAFLSPFLTWPDAKRAAKARQAGLTGARYRRLTQAAAGIRDAVAALWADGCQTTACELWDLVGVVVEHQDGHVEPSHCWVAGRALQSAACDLPFAFSVHTFMGPGRPCIGARANISAEASCISTSSSDPPELPKLKVLPPVSSANQPQPDGQGSKGPADRSDSPSTGYQKGAEGSESRGKGAVGYGRSSSLPSPHGSAYDERGGRPQGTRGVGDFGPASQGYDSGNARPEGTSSGGSSLSLTQTGWPPGTDAQLESKKVDDDSERHKENKRLILSAPAGLNECTPLFSSSSSQGSAEELETADLSAFLRSDSGKLEAQLKRQPMLLPDVPMTDTPFLTDKQAEATISEPSTATQPSMSRAALWVWGLSYPDPNRPEHAVAELHPAPDEEDPQWCSRSEDLPTLEEEEEVDEDDKMFMAGSTDGHDVRVSPVSSSQSQGGIMRSLSLSQAQPASAQHGRGSARGVDPSDALSGSSSRGEAVGTGSRGSRAKKGAGLTQGELAMLGIHGTLGGFEEEGREKRKKSFKRLSKLIVGMRRLWPAADCMRPDAARICAGKSFGSKEGANARVIRELPYEDNPTADVELDADEMGGSIDELDQEGVLEDEFVDGVQYRDRQAGGVAGVGAAYARADGSARQRERRTAVPAKVQEEVPGHVLKDPVSLNAGLARGGTRRHEGSGDSKEPVSTGGESQEGPTPRARHPNPGYPESSVDSIRNAALEQLLAQQGGEQAVGTAARSREGLFGMASSVSLPVNDLGDGRYLISGHLMGIGQYQVSVKIGGRHVQGSPAVIKTVPAAQLGSGISHEGPFYPHASLPSIPLHPMGLCPDPDFPPCHSASYDAERLAYAHNHPHIGTADILFVVDATASMAAELAELPRVVIEVANALAGAVLCKRARWGVLAYRDHWPEDDQPQVLTKLDFTEDIEKVCQFISRLEASGGGDYPEALEAALHEAADGVTWWPFSTRVVIWVGDAPPHGYQGMGPQQAAELEGDLGRARERLLQAATAVEKSMRDGRAAALWTEWDTQLVSALNACDGVAKHHDNFPLGVPGSIKWEEAAEHLASTGARVIALGFRDAIFHSPSEACLRTIAHITGGALLEVGALDGSLVGPLVGAVVEEMLDQQLVEEEVCDLLLCLHHDLRGQLALDQRYTIIETMNQTDKAVQRLQVVPDDGGRSAAGSRAGAPSSQPLSPGASESGSRRQGSGDSSQTRLGTSEGGGGQQRRRGESVGSEATTKSTECSLLLGMRRVQCDEAVLAQVYQGIRSKAETVGRALQKGFVTRSSWLASAEGSLSKIDMWGRQANWKMCEEFRTSPVSLRYLLAERTILGML